MSKMYRPERLKIARERRGFTKKDLASLVDLSPKTITAYESEAPQFLPQDETVIKLAAALEYPVAFFYKPVPDSVEAETISFRALSKLPSRLKLATESASTIAYELATWLESKFNLPKANLPEFALDNHQTATNAAMELRYSWGIGELSVRNMVHLLEQNGIRVFSLSEDCREVDAFSFWKGETPIVVLNQFKTPERSRFDAAHELAHLVLHKHGSQNRGRKAELEADCFASAFLMPEASVAEKVRPGALATLNDLIILKKHWNVSLMAMIRRLYDLKYLTEWQYRQLSIQASKLGYRTSEPEGMEQMEKSKILEMAFDALKAKGRTRFEIAEELSLPIDEISALTFSHRLFSMRVAGGNPALGSRQQEPTNLRLVK